MSLAHDRFGFGCAIMTVTLSETRSTRWRVKHFQERWRQEHGGTRLVHENALAARLQCVERKYRTAYLGIYRGSWEYFSLGLVGMT